MTQQTRKPYTFPDDVPLAPVDPGTNVLVTGPAIGRTDDCVLRMLTGNQDDGVLFLSTSKSAPELLSAYERCGGQFDRKRMAVIDCTEGSEGDQERNIWAISNPSDLTGIGMQFTQLYEQLYGGGFDRVRTTLHTLEPLLMYGTEMKTIYRFLHTLTGRISTADGLGFAVVDPDAHDEKILGSLSQPFDGRLDVREGEDGYELRVRGLAGQPEGWQAIDLP